MSYMPVYILVKTNDRGGNENIEVSKSVGELIDVACDALRVSGEDIVMSYNPTEVQYDLVLVDKDGFEMKKTDMFIEEWNV